MAVRLTARARLATVYIGLVAVAGVALIALTYLLVSRRTTNQVTVLLGRGDSPGPPPSLAEARKQTLNLLLVQSLIALGVVIVLAGLLGWLVAGQLLRPIRAISQTAQRVSAANVSERVATTGPADELTALAGTVNGMLDRVQHGIAERDRLLDGHRLFVANAAHELRTPLTTMRTAIDVTLDGNPSPPELHAMVADVSAAVDASQRTIDGLLALARSQTGSIRQQPVSLDRIAADAVEAVQGEATSRRIVLTARLDPAPLHGDATLLLRLVGNLIDNALRYNNPGGTVHLTTETRDQTVTLQIANTGPTVNPADLTGLFHPFVRGAGRVRSSGGAGLGLSIVDAITTAHAGTITSTAPPTGGLDLTVRFPRS